MLLQAPSTGLPFPGHRTLAEVRVCKTCGAELMRRRAETHGRFAARIFCSAACRKADQQNSSKARINQVLEMVERGLSRTDICAAMGLKMSGLIELLSRHRVKLPHLPKQAPVQPAPRVCEVCSNSFERRPDEKLIRFWSRRFCSKQCRCIGHSRWLLARAKPRSEVAQKNIDAIKVKLGQVITLSHAKRRPARPGTSFETMEEYLARGGAITVCPPMHVAPPWSMCHPRTVEGGRVSAGRS